MKLTSTRPPASRCATSKARPRHHRLRETNSSSVPSRPSISAAPRNSGTRNTRILAIDGLEQREQEAAGRRACRDRRRPRPRARPRPRRPAPGPRARTRRRSARRRAAASATAASSIIARWRPEYSSTIASCTMVSSRCVAGLSTGMRAFSAIATMISATSASPSETRRPTSRRGHEGGDGRRAGSSRRPARA